MEDRAVKIDNKNWSELRGLYLPESPDTILGLSAISNCIRWNELKFPTDNLTIYCLNGDWSDGTFVVLDMRHLFCDSLNGNSARLRTLLNLLDFTRVLRVMHVRLKHYSAISHAIQCKQLKLELNHSNLLYYMPKENVLKLAIKIETGPVGTLYSDPAYRKRGFGSAVVKSIFKQIGAIGYGATACVKEANLSSRAIFEKIGCQIIGEVYWISMECDWIDETLTE